MSFASLLLASSFVTACTSGPTYEFAGESSADGDGGKADGSGLFTFFNVRADTRKCFVGDGECGVGFFAARANRSTTQCGRGTAKAECKVTEIDWTGTAMPASVAQGYEDGLHAGTPLLLRGDVVPAADDSHLTLAVTEIWVGSTTDAVDGVFAQVKDNGVRCFRAPCPNLTENKLNSTLSANLTGLEFDEALANGADQAAVDLAHEQLYTEDGLVVVGYRTYDSEGGKMRTAAKFFTRAPVPLR